MNSNTEMRPCGLSRARRAVQWLRVLGLASFLTACGGGATTTLTLATPPNLYTLATGEPYPAANVPKGLRRTLTEILYVTDRNPVVGADGALDGYGTERSRSMSFGVSLVEYGDLKSWADLVAQTQAGDGQALTKLDPVYMEEFARFPETPLPFGGSGGRLRATADVAQIYEERSRVMRTELGARLRNHGLNRVLVYIHGFNNSFDDGVGTLANIWHYSGRRSLPVAYSWPAGNDGLLAYFRDAEAGDFSVFHVKEFLRTLASVPEVDRIDIVAHSRGTAVMTDALRELIIEARAKGQDPSVALKTGILVLAAADLDVGVAQQRLVAERFADGFEQINIYANPDDRALNLSRIIGNVGRLGSVDTSVGEGSDFGQLVEENKVNVIVVEEPERGLGHAYFRENPAVMSDMVLALRTRKLPGTAYRPLDRVSDNVWVLHPNYPAEILPDMLDQPVLER